MSHAGATAMPLPTPATAGKMVVARFADGRTLKGTTNDFLPGKDIFHIHLDGRQTAKAETVRMADLKAVFFVKDLSGASERKDRYDFAAATGYGRKVVLTFLDGEEMAGLTNGYSPKAQGFFLSPADPDGNNVRIYVLNKAVRNFRWA